MLLFLCSRVLYKQQLLLQHAFHFHGLPYAILQPVYLFIVVHVAFHFVISIKIAKLGR